MSVNRHPLAGVVLSVDDQPRERRTAPAAASRPRDEPRAPRLSLARYRRDFRAGELVADAEDEYGVRVTG
jgi:hypothetical protein